MVYIGKGIYRKRNKVYSVTDRWVRDKTNVGMKCYKNRRKLKNGNREI